MRAVVSPEQKLAIQQLVATFKVGTSLPLRAFQKVLGLLGSALPVLQLGVLRMHPLQFLLNSEFHPTPGVSDVFAPK